MWPRVGIRFDLSRREWGPPKQNFFERKGVSKTGMGQFVSTFTNKIDSKGRVSVPASFRAILAKEDGEGIYCYPSLDAPALDAGGTRLVNQIGELLEELAPLW